MTQRLFVPLLDNGNGSVMANFMMDHIAAFAGREINMIRASDSHADRGMNKIANAFLDSDCNIWINIDADIRFSKADIDRLLSHDLPLVYGIYPKKQDDSPPCVCTFATVPEPDENGLVEVRRAGRGFMLVKREVLEAMKEDNGGPALRYHNHDKLEWNFFESGPVTGEFSALEPHTEAAKEHKGTPKILSEPLRSVVPIVRDQDGFPKREWLSEDWMFCERARKLGFKTIVDTQIALGHVGHKDYRFKADQVTRVDSNISSWKQIEGWFDFEEVYRKLVEAIPVNGRFVEVGSWLGRSTAAFVAFAKEAGKTIHIHTVDTFAGAPANEKQEAILKVHGGNVEKMFRANMEACGVNGELSVHVSDSAEAANQFQDESLDAVFIDADHSEEAVKSDIRAWLPKVKRGGILAGHDYDESGVMEGVNKSFPITPIETIGRCWLVKV